MENIKTLFTPDNSLINKAKSGIENIRNNSEIQKARPLLLKKYKKNHQPKTSINLIIKV
jgi:hypothetical protein